MKKITQITLAAAVAIASITTASASLTLDQNESVQRTSPALMKTLLDSFPVARTASLASIVTQNEALNGTSVEHVAAVQLQADGPTALNIARPPVAIGADVDNQFLNGVANALTPVLTSQASVDKLTDERTILALMYDRFTVGIANGHAALSPNTAAVNDGDGIDTAPGLALATAAVAGVTRDNVTLLDILNVVFSIRLKD